MELQDAAASFACAERRSYNCCARSSRSSQSEAFALGSLNGHPFFEGAQTLQMDGNFEGISSKNRNLFGLVLGWQDNNPCFFRWV